MNPLVIGVILLAWGLYIYRNTTDAAALKALQDKSGLPYKLIRLDILKLSLESYQKYSKYAMGAGAIFLGLAYMKYKKDQKLSVSQKTFAF